MGLYFGRALEVGALFFIAAVLFQFSSRSGQRGSRREPAVKGAALRARADVQRCS